MPLTFPAHQAFVLPLKLWRPTLVDGTALVVASAAPDLAYPLGEWLDKQSHTAIGLVVWAVPVTLVTCGLLRWRSARGLFAQLPDAGPLRLRSYRALVRRRPSVIVTVLSALLGAGSHVLIDAFTHRGRWGAQWMGFDKVIGELPVRGEFTTARVLQYTGHSVGSVVGLCLLGWIGHRRLMEQWYGAEQVAEDRAVQLQLPFRVLFWLVVIASVAAGLVLADRQRPFAMITAAVVGLLLAGMVPTRVSLVPKDPGGPSG